MCFCSPGSPNGGADGSANGLMGAAAVAGGGTCAAAREAEVGGGGTGGAWCIGAGADAAAVMNGFSGS